MSVPARIHHEATRHAELQPIHPPPTSFWRRYLFSTDHKVIAKQFLWAGLVFMAVGGLLAMQMRWQWAFPGEKLPAVLGSFLYRANGGVIGPADYQVIFTTHGLVMIFFVITPILIGCVGNWTIPLHIGARDMAFPTLNMLSFWVFALSGLLAVASLFGNVGGGGAGWTTYPPLSSNVGTPGTGQTLLVAALFTFGTSTLMGAINYVTTVIRFRAPGMTYGRLTLVVWGEFLTAILNILWVPVIAAGVLLLFLDRTFGTQFFIAGATAVRGGGDPVLFQHLFWLFGHPEVYILILPAWGLVGDLLSFFARKPAFWYRGTVGAFIAVTVISGIVYGHHMYVAGINPLVGEAFMVLTLVISIPAIVLFLNWMMTLWKGSIRATVPMLFAMGVVFVFGIGGLTGLFLGDISLDIYLHDTLFVVGHFHFTLAAATFLASFAAIYFWFPKMFGRQMNETLGRIHFWCSIVGICIVFSMVMAAGWSGMQRRLWDPYQYEFLKHLRGLNRTTSYFAWVLGASQLVFAWNWLSSMFGKREAAPQNPWNVGTLEWTVATSPPAHHNYDVIPTVLRGPHEFSDPEIRSRTGRDWAGQAEVVGEAAPAVARGA
jgi:cytochrome c oxidase subunit 1